MKLRNELYTLIDAGEGQRTPVQIVKGEYTGLTVLYGEVKFLENKDSCKLSFDYEITANPYSVGLSDKEKLRQVLGDVLLDIIEGLHSD